MPRSTPGIASRRSSLKRPLDGSTTVTRHSPGSTTIAPSETDTAAALRSFRRASGPTVAKTSTSATSLPSSSRSIARILTVFVASTVAIAFASWRATSALAGGASATCSFADRVPELPPPSVRAVPFAIRARSTATSDFATTTSAAAPSRTTAISAASTSQRARVSGATSCAARTFSSNAAARSSSSFAATAASAAATRSGSSAGAASISAFGGERQNSRARRSSALASSTSARCWSRRPWITRLATKTPAQKSSSAAAVAARATGRDSGRRRALPPASGGSPATEAITAS